MDPEIISKESSVSCRKILEAALAFRKTEIILQALKHDVFSIIHNWKKPMNIDQLADCLDVDKNQLERLLNACCTLGLLKRNVVEDDICYENTAETSIYLTVTSDNNLIDYINHIASLSRQFFPLTINRQKSTSDDDGPDQIEAKGYYEMVHNNPDLESIFDKAMDSSAKTVTHMLNEIDFTPYNHIVDLGGGLGRIAKLIKMKNKQAKVTLAEKEMIIEKAKPTCEGFGIEFKICDFFDGKTLPKADLYVLGHILHNWGDESCKIILRNVWTSLNSNGMVLILERHLSANKDGPLLTSIKDIDMLAKCGDGKERTLSEMKLLLERQGFQLSEVYSGDLCVLYDGILAEKI